jgi:hypothetical protein
MGKRLSAEEKQKRQEDKERRQEESRLKREEKRVQKQLADAEALQARVQARRDELLKAQMEAQGKTPEGTSQVEATGTTVQEERGTVAGGVAATGEEQQAERGKSGGVLVTEKSGHLLGPTASGGAMGGVEDTPVATAATAGSIDPEDYKWVIRLEPRGDESFGVGMVKRFPDGNQAAIKEIEKVCSAIIICVVANLREQVTGFKSALGILCFNYSIWLCRLPGTGRRGRNPVARSDL